jgi:glycosyltransferase involved in cell wall biosynthesis
MNILQVYPIFNPEVASGAAKVAYDISKKLVERKHNITFLTSDMVYWGVKCKAGRYTIDNISVYRLKTFAPIIAKKYKISITPQLLSFCRAGHLKKFDVVHLHAYISFQNLVLYHFIKKSNVPYVLQAHGSLPRVGAWQRLKWIYDVFFGYKLLKDATKVIALSKVEAEQYKSAGVPDNKVAIIPNGIDISKYAELPPKGAFKKKFNIPEDRKIILYLGRIHKTKGIDLLIRAYAHLKNEMKCRDVILVIAGPDDGYLSDAKALANSLGVYNSVIFTGFISSEDKLMALVDAEVFVTPSFYGFPMTFLEACAVGTPIVTTNLGDKLEWMDENVGYVTQPTFYDLAEAIYRIISDDELHRKFSKNCIEIAKSEFSMEKVIERLEKVYEEVVKCK